MMGKIWNPFEGKHKQKSKQTHHAPVHHDMGIPRLGGEITEPKGVYHQKKGKETKWTH